MNAFTDPEYWKLVGANVNKLALMPPQDFTGLPSHDELLKLSWPELIALRKKLKTTEAQNAVAPYEHRAYAREFSSTPKEAATNALLSIGYTPYKALTGVGRSDPSLQSIGYGLAGAWEGLTK